MRALLILALLAGCVGAERATTFSTVGAEMTAGPTPMITPSPTPTPAAEPGKAYCEAIDVVTDVISPTWSGLAEGTLDFEQAAATMGAAATTLEQLAEEELNTEARADIEALAANARLDQDALERETVFGGGDAGLMADIVIKWTDRGFRCP